MCIRDRSTYMMDAILMGETCERMPSGTRLAWDAKKRSFGNAAADNALTVPYRKGWELAGL